MKRPQMIDRRRKALGYPGHGVYARRNKSAIKQIVWHYSAVARKNRATIERHERYWKNHHGWDIGGYHYYIDADGVLYWNYDLEIVTYGAGRLNPSLVHICVEANSASDYTQKQIQVRENLTRWLMKELGISADNVKGHREIPYNSTSCPGYTKSQMDEFRRKLRGKVSSNKTSSKKGVSSSFLVRVNIPNLNIRTGPGTNYRRVGRFTGRGVFTIVETRSGQGSRTGWGKLKSGVGWISLDYAHKI